MNYYVIRHVYILQPQWNVIDPICTFFFSILVIISTLPVIRDAIPVLMESTTNTHDNDSSITGVPRNIDITQVENELQNLPDVIHTHSIHIWSLTVNKPVLQAHLAISGLLMLTITVEPPNKGHFGTKCFVLCIEVVLFWRFKMY
jgi:zinc transporter 2